MLTPKDQRQISMMRANTKLHRFLDSTVPKCEVRILVIGLFISLLLLLVQAHDLGRLIIMVDVTFVLISSTVSCMLAGFCLFLTHMTKKKTTR